MNAFCRILLGGIVDKSLYMKNTLRRLSELFCQKNICEEKNNNITSTEPQASPIPTNLQAQIEELKENCV